VLPIKLALIMGGKSSEREISLASGREVLAHLDSQRYQVSVYDPATDLARLVADAPNLDLAMPVLHGLGGEDGTIQGFLSLLGLPYVGSGVLASAQAIDKNITKNIYRFNKLPVAPDILLECSQGLWESLGGRDLKNRLDSQEVLEVLANISKEEEGPLAASLLQVEKDLGFPVVVKPLDQGSSVGLSLVKNKSELKISLLKAWACSPRALVEKFLEGREFTSAVLGNRKLTSLPPVEIIPGPGHAFFDYSAKYDPGESQEICPADLTASEIAQISDLALKAHLALGCRGISRTDFILKNGVFYLLETNTLPGLTQGSLVPKAAQAYGLTFTAFLDRLIALALEKP
jgi:D-alanine-D-alanine ligase